MNRRLTWIILAFVIFGAVVFFGLTQLQSKTEPTYSADVISLLGGGDSTGFTRATNIRDFSFPKDYGIHPDFQTEWWYYTGNLVGADGRRFGFEFTIFRHGLTPTTIERTSDWATSQAYSADLAISDIGGNQFYRTGRFSRGAAGLAGVEAQPRLHLWIDDWSMQAQDVDAKTMHLKATDNGISIDLTTTANKPPTLQGDHGLSTKGSNPGEASYYYSLTRLLTDGTITINGTSYKVTGTAWMDHEFSTHATSPDLVGWDWYALQLDDNREIMLYHLRNKDGSISSFSDGTLINADGTSTRLTKEDYSIDVLDKWTSPTTNTTYPAKWHMMIKTPTGPITLDIAPLMANQELVSTAPYWEGASRITGTASGYGYVELTGYAIGASGQITR